MGLVAPAFAADSGIQVVNTGIKADSVVNYDGYGSLKIDSDIEDDPDDYGNYVGTPAQLALIDRNGSFVFPYRADSVGDGYFVGDARFYYSDGIASLTLGNTYYNGGIPQYYKLDGSNAFLLEETENEHTEDGVTYHDSTSWLGGPMYDGYALVIQKLYSFWSIPGFGGGSSDGDNRTLIIDKNGTVTYELPPAYNETLQWGTSGFTTRMSLGWCGEGLFAFFEHTTGDYEQEDYNVYTVGKGYMDSFGQTVIDLSGRGYIDLYPFHEGLAAVKDPARKIGFIDKTGTLVIPCVYDGVGSFCDGLCSVSKDGKRGYIDKEGAVIIPLEYDGTCGAGDGLAAVVKDGKCGLVDYNNNIVVPLEYDDISSYDGGIAYGIKNGTVHLISGYQQGIQAQPTNDSLLMDGKPVEAAAYKIAGSNYFKLRDVAALLTGTPKQFSVGYDSAAKSAVITTGQPYQLNGTELKGKPTAGGAATVSGDSVIVNGQKAELTVYKINGENYFKLRDLGRALDFNVGWSKDKGMYIDSGRSYTDAD